MALNLKHENLGDLFSNLAIQFQRLNGRSYAAPIQMDTFVYAMSNMLGRFIIDDVNIPITGQYATDGTYIDQEYGIKIGYMPDQSSIILTAKGGSSTAREYLGFRLASGSNENITLETSTVANTNATGKASIIYGCVLTGFDPANKYKIEVSVDEDPNTNYDVTYVDIMVTSISKRSSTEEINFSIEGIPFTCKNNMTWFDFMDSPFERDPEDYHLLGTDGSYIYYNHPTIGNYQVDGVYLTSLIQDGVDYKLIQEASTMSARTGDNPSDENEEIEFWRTRFDVIN